MEIAAAHAQVRLVSASPRNGDPPAQPAYVDRVIEGIAPQEPETESRPGYDPAGWPRFLRLETRLGTLPFEGSGRSVGFSAAGAIVTPNHGTISVEANAAPDDNRKSFTVRQRELPVEGGWTVNNELGVTASLAPILMRQPSRIFVPSQYLRGAATEWLNPGEQMQVMAGGGRPGWLQGYPVAGFEPLSGNLAMFGLQRGFGSWAAAIRHERGNGLSLLENPTLPSDYQDSSSTHAAVRAESGAHTVQVNAVSTLSTETSDTRRGFWVDGETRIGTSSYGWGVFRLDPRLSWSGQGMASDTEGVFTRGSWRTRRWSADANVDALRSISRPEESGVYVAGNGRWRYSRTLTLGAGGSYRDYSGSAGTAFVDARQRNDWGFTGIRLDGSDGRGLRSQRLSLDHAWIVPQGWTLSTGLLAGRESGENAAGTLWGGAVSVAAPLGNDVTLLGNASTERRENGTRSTGANVSVLWRLGSHWSLEGNFLYSQGRQGATLPLDPLAPPPDRLLATTDTRSYYLVLRYEDSAGSRSVPLGGTPVSGGGSIEGVVFLDGNRTGTQEAGESGAAGVTVYLDGRFAMRTDAQGRFAFPFVGPGTRVIRILNETLPLPWDAGERQDTRVEVVVREATRVAIPVVRRGGE
jgi:hypothetical protein